MNGLSSLHGSQGLVASMRAFDRTASAVSSTTVPANDELPDETSSVPGLVDALVGMRVAANDVKANIAAMRTADEMLGTLLDMQA